MFRLFCLVFMCLCGWKVEYCCGMYAYVPYTQTQEKAVELARNLCYEDTQKNQKNCEIIYRQLREIWAQNFEEIYDRGDVTELVTLCLETFKKYNNKNDQK